MVKADACSKHCRVASRCGLVNGSQGWPHITVCHLEPHNKAITTSLGSWKDYFPCNGDLVHLSTITAECKYSRVQLLFSYTNTHKKVCIQYLAITHLESYHHRYPYLQSQRHLPSPQDALRIPPNVRNPKSGSRHCPAQLQQL